MTFFRHFASRNGRRALATSGLLAAGLLVAAACSSSSTSKPAAAAAGAQAATAAPMSSAPAAAQSTPVTVAAGKSSLGSIAVDASGRTLYRYDKDIVGSGTSKCNGACATAWPPALVSGQPAPGPGLTGTLSVVTRADGSHQIALDGHPLYRFSGDQNPGDTTGNGFGGIWHVVPATASTAATASASVPAAGSYGY